MKRATLQCRRCYAWEKTLRIEERPPTTISVRKPFAPEFLEFFARAWNYGYALYGNSRVRTAPNLIAAYGPPVLKFTGRLSRTAGHAGLGVDEAGYIVPMITLGFAGMTRPTLLHETAHILTFRHAESHGPDFCRVALSLYVKFLGVDEARALKLADEHNVEIA